MAIKEAPVISPHAEQDCSLQPEHLGLSSSTSDPGNYLWRSFWLAGASEEKSLSLSVPAPAPRLVQLTGKQEGEKQARSLSAGPCPAPRARLAWLRPVPQHFCCPVSPLGAAPRSATPPAPGWSRWWGNCPSFPIASWGAAEICREPSAQLCEHWAAVRTADPRGHALSPCRASSPPPLEANSSPWCLWPLGWLRPEGCTAPGGTATGGSTRRPLASQGVRGDALEEGRPGPERGAEAVGSGAVGGAAAEPSPTALPRPAGQEVPPEDPSPPVPWSREVVAILPGPSAPQPGHRRWKRSACTGRRGG